MSDFDLSKITGNEPPWEIECEKCEELQAELEEVKQERDSARSQLLEATEKERLLQAQLEEANKYSNHLEYTVIAREKTNRRLEFELEMVRKYKKYKKYYELSQILWNEINEQS